MTLAQRLAEYVRACFTGLWITSFEHDDALSEIAQLCQQENWRLASWDIDQGFLMVGGGAAECNQATDPLAAIRAATALASPDGAALIVFKNFHRYLQSAEIVQALHNQLTAGKQQRIFYIVLAPVVQIPLELEKQFVVIEHELPGREQLESLARGIATEPGELPAGADLERVLDAASGLTRYEAEGAFSLALVRHERIEPQTIWELKSQTLVKSGLLSLYRGGETFEQLGGLEPLKAFCRRALRPRSTVTFKCQPRGLLLLGISGSGKSRLLQGLGKRDGTPHVDSGCRQPDGFSGRSDRRANPAGAADRRLHAAGRTDDR